MGSYSRGEWDRIKKREVASKAIRRLNTGESTVDETYIGDDSAARSLNYKIYLHKLNQNRNRETVKLGSTASNDAKKDLQEILRKFGHSKKKTLLPKPAKNSKNPAEPETKTVRASAKRSKATSATPKVITKAKLNLKSPNPQTGTFAAEHILNTTSVQLSIGEPSFGVSYRLKSARHIPIKALCLHHAQVVVYLKNKPAASQVLATCHKFTKVSNDVFVVVQRVRERKLRIYDSTRVPTSAAFRKMIELQFPIGDVFEILEQ